MRIVFKSITTAAIFSTAFLAGAQTNGISPQIVPPTSNHAYETNIEIGINAVAQKKWEKAIHYFSGAIRLDPTESAGYELRGTSYLARGMFEAAIEDLTQVIKLDPSNDQAYFNRGGALRGEGKFGQAIDDFTASIRLNSTNVLAYSSRATCYNSLDRVDEEIEDWTKVLRTLPNDVGARAKRGMAYSRSKQYHKAVGDFRAVIQAGSAEPLVYNDLAWLQATCPSEQIRNGNEAVDNATQACELSHWSEPDYIDTLAAAYAEKKDFEKAVEYQQKAIALDKQPEGVRGMRERLLLYEQNKPYRDEPLKKDSANLSKKVPPISNSTGARFGGPPISPTMITKTNEGLTESVKSVQATRDGASRFTLVGPACLSSER